jgi:hypothetical protein
LSNAEGSDSREAVGRSDRHG